MMSPQLYDTMSPVYIDSAWFAIVPPAYSSTHPTAFRPPHAISIRHAPDSILPSPILRTQPRYSPPIADSTLFFSSSSFPSGYATPASTLAFSSSLTSKVDTHDSILLDAGTATSEQNGLTRRHPGRSGSKKGADGTTGAALPIALDRFATSYVPSWLRNLPPPLSILSLPPSSPFPSHQYTNDVFPYVAPITFHPSESVLALAPYPSTPVPLESHRAYEEGYYSAHFSALLSLLLKAQMDDLVNSTLYMAPLHLELSSATYRLEIPGVREDLPRLTNGDRLVLRGLYPGLKLPASLAVEAEVVGSIKAKGWVYVKAAGLEEVDASLPRWPMNGTKDGAKTSPMYQVQSMVSAVPVCTMQDAVRLFGVLLGRGALQGSSRSIARRWLFPEIIDIPPKPVARCNVDAGLVDISLNEEQRDAVTAIAGALGTPVPHLISGPPGTGKTRVIVETALQILIHQPHSAILLCAPSNPAADTLVQRLGKALEPSDMLRLNSPSRTFAEVPGEVLKFCYVENDTFHIPPFAQLMCYKIVVTTCLDAAILVKGNATNMATMGAERRLYQTLHPNGTNLDFRASLHWTHLLVDEAGQASEPETLIPLSVVVPPLDDRQAVQEEEPVIVLCGDMHQLGPIIPSSAAQDAELGVSLLERLFQRDIYSSHPEARSNKKAFHILEQIVKESFPSPPFSNLYKNYRSIAPLLMVPAALFYEDTLEPAAEDVTLLRWSGLPNPKIPILFQGCETREDWIEEGASWFNDGEITLILETIRSLLAECKSIQQEDIAIITPWREQVWRARAKLRNHGLGGVDVGNVETYQGREFKVTIISCVRSRARFLDGDRKTNMGLYNERKRFNVSITRAKELLVVVGNANLLKSDPYWNAFLQVALRNGLYVGPEVEMEMTGAYMSQLESLMRYQEETGGDDSGMTLAGSMARVTLRE